MGANTVLVARTDAEAATLLDSNIDGRDHPFILGVTTPGVGSLLDASDSKAWAAKANLMTFSEAVLAKIQSLPIGERAKRNMVAK